MPLVINALRGGHTQRDIPTWEQKQFQETRHLLATRGHVPRLKRKSLKIVY